MHFLFQAFRAKAVRLATAAAAAGGIGSASGGSVTTVAGGDGAGVSDPSISPLGSKYSLSHKTVRRSQEWATFASLRSITRLGMSGRVTGCNCYKCLVKDLRQ